MRDLYSNLDAVPALAPAVQSAAVQGPAIDLITCKGVVFVVATGAIASSGDFGVTLQESPDGSTGWADVDAEQLQTNAPATLEEASTYRLGYLGFERYVRLSLTKAGGTSIAAGAVAIRDPLTRPVA
ncbi:MULTISPECIES: hypothetical protein [Alphaproteobacteria]|uniref:hypothetical protein n=1 Tax=Alphaproteobacteria TaxID=28211 RepID=UPI0035165332